MSKKGKHKDRKKADEVADEAVPEASGETVPLEDYEALQARYQEAVDLNLRQRADFDNIRKRLRRSADEAGDRALAGFIRPVLVELDNLGLAIEHAKPENFAEFAQGVTMLQENLLGILRQSGIEPIATEGIFDPALHEVIAEVEAEEPRGTIVAVQRTGYRLHDQVIRAAQVIVARARPEPEAQTETEAQVEAEAGNGVDDDQGPGTES